MPIHRFPVISEELLRSVRDLYVSMSELREFGEECSRMEGTGAWEDRALPVIRPLARMDPKLILLHGEINREESSQIVDE